MLIGDRRAQGRDRDPAGAHPDRQGALQRRPLARHTKATARPRSIMHASRSTRRFPTASRTSLRLIDDRMGKLENKRDLVALPQPEARASKPSRATVAMPSCSARSPSTTAWRRSWAASSACRSTTSRSPSSSLPACRSEIVNVVVSVLCRMTFDFALWSEGQGARDARLRRSAPLRSRKCGVRLRAVQTRHRQDRQGRPQVRRFAVHRHAAPGRDRSDHPVPVQYRVRAAHVERPRPGDRGVGRSPTPARGCSSSCPRSASARRSPSATAWRFRCASSSTSCRDTALPRSSTARFTEKWQKSLGDEGFLDQHRRALACPGDTSRRGHDAQPVDDGGRHRHT